VCKAGTVIETRSHVASASTKDEVLIKGYMVSSVNEWGFDQTRILLVLFVERHAKAKNYAQTR
jgi:hypothetical protein